MLSTNKQQTQQIVNSYRSYNAAKDGLESHLPGTISQADVEGNKLRYPNISFDHDVRPLGEIEELYEDSVPLTVEAESNYLYGKGLYSRINPSSLNISGQRASLTRNLPDQLIQMPRMYSAYEGIPKNYQNTSAMSRNKNQLLNTRVYVGL